MNIQLSDHFNYRRLFRFTLPSIVMMIFTSIYGVVDGLFVSNFVGKTPFAAINLVMPFIMILGGVGFMIGRTMPKKVRKGPQPSILAASSISSGMLLTKPQNMKTASPAPKPR